MVNKPDAKELIEEQNIQVRDPQLIPPPLMGKGHAGQAGDR